MVSSHSADLHLGQKCFAHIHSFPIMTDLAQPADEISCAIVHRVCTGTSPAIEQRLWSPAFSSSHDKDKLDDSDYLAWVWKVMRFHECVTMAVSPA